MNPIYRLRILSGMTQSQLAKLAGTSQPTIAAYELGTKSPTFNTLSKMANTLGLEVDIHFVPPLTEVDRRSLAYHQAIVEKLKKKPSEVLKKARRNLLLMQKENPHANALFKKWHQWLSLPVEDLIHYCLDASLIGRDMRQVTPFSGILSAKERLDVIRQFRKKRNYE